MLRQNNAKMLRRNVTEGMRHPMALSQEKILKQKVPLYPAKISAASAICGGKANTIRKLKAPIYARLDKIRKRHRALHQESLPIAAS